MMKIVFMEKIIIVMFFLFINGCATQENNQKLVASNYVDVPQQFIENELIGIWALEPLRGGTANVIEFKPGKVHYLYPFKCNADNAEEAQEIIQKGTYEIIDNIISITLDGDSEPFTLLRFGGIRRQSISINPGGEIKSLKLIQIIDHGKNSFELDLYYLKRQKVASLCGLIDLALFFSQRYGCRSIIDCLFKGSEEVVN